MSDLSILILTKDEHGLLHRVEGTFTLDMLGGILPSIGDEILNPYVNYQTPRHHTQNRELLKIVGRVFNPRDKPDAIALICEERTPEDFEIELMPTM